MKPSNLADSSPFGNVSGDKISSKNDCCFSNCHQRKKLTRKL